MLLHILIHNTKKDTPTIANIIFFIFFTIRLFILTVSQKPAVNKRKSVGTIAYYSVEALDCPLLSNEAIAHAIRYTMPFQKGTIIQSVSSIAIISRSEIVQISTGDNIKTLYIKIESSSRQVFSCRSNSNAKVVIISENRIILNKFFPRNIMLRHTNKI